MIRIQKGVKDVLPLDSYKWHYLEKRIREITKLYGFKEIRTPTFEATELFSRGIGQTTDIVNKEMYTFEDKGGRSITLKPEGTAGVARSYVENNIAQDLNPAKMYYIAPLFRYERPQSGRLREHHQFGVEIFGSESYLADLDVISLGYRFFRSLGIDDIRLNVNDIGCRECRKNYNRALKEFYSKNIDSICPVCKERLEKNPLRILDCKEAKCSELNQSAPSISDYICQSCKSHKDNLYKGLRRLGIDFVENDKIVRGLDYYTGTVFEFISDSLGAQSTVCGGGRYNNLVEEIGGKSTPAVGFGLGLERLIMILESLGLPIGEPETPKLFIINVTEKEQLDAAYLAYDFRSKGISAECNMHSRSVKSQMKYANKNGYRYVIILGEEEVKNGRYTLRSMETGKEVQGTSSELSSMIMDL